MKEVGHLGDLRPKGKDQNSDFPEHEKSGNRTTTTLNNKHKNLNKSLSKDKDKQINKKSFAFQEDHRVDEYSPSENHPLESVGDLKSQHREKALGKSSANLKNRPTVPKMIEWWRLFLLDLGYERKSHISFTAKERGMAKNLIKQFGEETLPFLEYALTNWGALRKRIVFDNKKSRLPEHPSFQELYFNREDIMAFRDKGVKEKEKAKVITRLKDIPKDRNDYKMLVRVFKMKGEVTLM